MKKDSSVVIKSNFDGSWIRYSKRTNSYVFVINGDSIERYCLFTINHTIAVKLAVLGIRPNNWYSTNDRLIKLLNSEAINDN
jgi:hypothetical protein